MPRSISPEGEQSRVSRSLTRSLRRVRPNGPLRYCRAFSRGSSRDSRNRGLSLLLLPRPKPPAWPRPWAGTAGGAPRPRPWSTAAPARPAPPSPTAPAEGQGPGPGRPRPQPRSRRTCSARSSATLPVEATAALRMLPAARHGAAGHGSARGGAGGRGGPGRAARLPQPHASRRRAPAGWQQGVRLRRAALLCAPSRPEGATGTGWVPPVLSGAPRAALTPAAPLRGIGEAATCAAPGSGPSVTASVTERNGQRGDGFGWLRWGIWGS